jgi:hypothetical protein
MGLNNSGGECYPKKARRVEMNQYQMTKPKAAVGASHHPTDR